MAPDFVELAQQSASSAAFELGALQLLGREVGFDAAFFLVKGLEPFATIVGLDAKTKALALTHAGVYAEELRPVKRAALAARGVAVDTHVCGSEHVQKTRYYREIAASVGGRHSLMAYVPWRGHVVAALMLGRAGTGFSRHDIERVESALPALGVARAAWGTPWVSDPLPAAPKSSLLSRIGLAERSRVLESVSTDTCALFVRDRAGFREMVARRGESELVWTRASLANPSQSGWPYIELFHLAPAIATRRCRALFVGSGGAVSVRQFAASYPGIAIDLVEREPAVIELARRWFDLGSIPGLRVHIADGAEFVRQAAPASWDVLVIDAYDVLPQAPEFSERGFLLAARQALRPGGALACNIIGTLDGQGPVSEFVASARSVFDGVRAVPVIAPGEAFERDALRNVVVIANRTS